MHSGQLPLCCQGLPSCQNPTRPFLQSVCGVADDRVLCCRYQPRSIETKVRAILSTSGFLDSTEAAPEGPLGIVLEQTPFYAGMRSSRQILAPSRQCYHTSPAAQPEVSQLLSFDMICRVWRAGSRHRRAHFNLRLFCSHRYKGLVPTAPYPVSINMGSAQFLPAKLLPCAYLLQDEPGPPLADIPGGQNGCVWVNSYTSAYCYAGSSRLCVARGVHEQGDPPKWCSN